MNPAAAFLIALGLWLILTEGILPNLDSEEELPDPPAKTRQAASLL